jgi:hypothetical protein
VPVEWRVSLSGSNSLSITAPDGLSAYLRVSADQGATLSRFGGARGEFVGLPAVDLGSGGDQETYFLHVNRQLVQLVITNPQAGSRKTLERILAGALGGEVEPEVHPGPVSPAIALREVVLAQDPAPELALAWSVSVLGTYWKRVAAVEELEVLSQAAARAQALAARSRAAPQAQQLVAQAWSARAERRLAAARVALRDPVWLQGRELSARWVPVAELPPALQDHAAHVDAAQASVRAQKQLWVALERAARWDDLAAVQVLVTAGEALAAEGLAEVQARLAARLAHDAHLKVEGGLLGRYGLE